MSDELFNVEESLSPRAEWMRKNAVVVDEYEDEHGMIWKASIPQGLQETSRDGRDDVLRRIAQRMHTQLNTPVWNTPER